RLSSDLTLGLTSRFTSNSVLTYTSNRITGEPVENTRASLYINSDKLTEGLISASTFTYTYSEANKTNLLNLTNAQPLIIVQKDNEIAVSDPFYYFYGSPKPFTARSA